MQAQFETSYQRMEQSLQRLTDSIAAYNPSVSAANDLAAADDAVNKNLDQLVEHQRNHTRIQELKRATETMDETLKSHFRMIIDLRRELASVPPNDSSDNVCPEVSIEELLAYAKFISKTTVPPTFRKQDVPQKLVTGTALGTHISNGIATPPSGVQETSSGNLQTENIGVKAMNSQDKAWLESATNLPFEPWPSFDVIQGGTLAEIQRMVERGEDPAKKLSPEEQIEADRRKQEADEKERLVQEEAERRRMSMFDVARRRTNTQDDVFDPDA
ncbi:Hypothetical protein R9X50_00329200 [Acrodontium crateriforme]|uniref:Mediator of RNA polymerase II transcription subunit 4 n=1 Tax=Acrodontium crateriforme TaxID=150365 RepID=A0AAQ3RBQ8_9PEZI|nr:Hypothetical protein R9X50_00329200 [Acrodontium crateriforme]